MVATGSSENKAQVVDVQSNTKCTGLPDYPIYLRWATGGLMDGRPLICGDYRKTGSSGSNQYQSSCYVFNKEIHQWELHANLKSERRGAASAILDNGSLFITGGFQYPGDGTLASTEIISPDGSVNQGMDLPEATWRHCMVTMDDGRIAIIGGTRKQGKKVYIYNPQTNSYEDGPSLLFDRDEAGCTLFYSAKHGGRPVILISGGDYQTTSEIFDYTISNSWEQIGSLPTSQTTSFYGAKALPSLTGDGAILHHRQHLYRLTCSHSSCNWEII